MGRSLATMTKTTTLAPPRVPRRATLLPLLLLLAASPSAAQAAVKVEKTTPVVERKIFDPNDPPKDMPPRKGEEAALCVYEMTCPTNISVEAVARVGPGDKTTVLFNVRGVTCTLGLKVTIWVPSNATEKLIAHEDGHREIAERWYEKADAVIRTAAGKIDGKRAVGQNRSIDEAQRIAGEQLKALNQQIADAFKSQVTDPADRVQALYDEITEHGKRATPDERTAIRQAFDRQAAEAKAEEARKAAEAKRPATRPATKPAAPPTTPTTRPVRPKA